MKGSVEWTKNVIIIIRRKLGKGEGIGLGFDEMVGGEKRREKNKTVGEIEVGGEAEWQSGGLSKIGIFLCRLSQRRLNVLWFFPFNPSPPSFPPPSPNGNKKRSIF